MFRRIYFGLQRMADHIKSLEPIGDPRVNDAIGWCNISAQGISVHNATTSYIARVNFLQEERRTLSAEDYRSRLEENSQEYKDVLSGTKKRNPGEGVLPF